MRLIGFVFVFSIALLSVVRASVAEDLVGTWRESETGVELTMTKKGSLLSSKSEYLGKWEFQPQILALLIEDATIEEYRAVSIIQLVCDYSAEHEVNLAELQALSVYLNSRLTAEKAVQFLANEGINIATDDLQKHLHVKVNSDSATIAITCSDGKAETARAFCSAYSRALFSLTDELNNKRTEDRQPIKIIEVQPAMGDGMNVYRLIHGKSKLIGEVEMHEDLLLFRISEKEVVKLRRVKEE